MCRRSIRPRCNEFNNDRHELGSYRARSVGTRGGSRQGSPSWEITHSGNWVSLEQELLKSGEVGSANSLNRAIVKVFNQMLMTSLKG